MTKLNLLLKYSKDDLYNKAFMMTVTIMMRKAVILLVMMLRGLKMQHTDKLLPLF